ncbi:uncharacterized protein LOC132617548 [Lycium barbarum]|uniref:uncharacterized protein LOC132617548 n=1 Tax=Lycium barbarum TaxID=112863 RepID=UPI00293E639F|nr:uncharacterized protein LOC132617548 [Lycium barbarum]
MGSAMLQQQMIEQEKELKGLAEKWGKIEESIRQKSRVQWLNLGVVNTSYFFASMKNRNSMNHIRNLQEAAGCLLKTDQEIQAEVLGFYKNLLGSNNNQLPAIDPNFSQVSSLMVNKSKSSVFFGGVDDVVQKQILDYLEFGCPSKHQEDHYYAMLQLVKSVLFAIQTFWAQIFVLPKKIIQLIEDTCRTFLGLVKQRFPKNPLLAWHKLCWPETAGGLNLVDIGLWNKAVICKHYWNLCKKKDRLWIQWVHVYYIKKDSVWEVDKPTVSWIIRKILKGQRHFDEAGYSQQEVMDMDNFSIKKLYQGLRGDFTKVPWRRLVCNNIGLPKWTFTLRLTAHRKLYARTRLAKWGVVDDKECMLCNTNDEDVEHLSFKCSYSKTLWTKLLGWQGISRQVLGWNAELEWAARFMTGKNAKTLLYRMVMASCVYYVWQKRNN